MWSDRQPGLPRSHARTTDRRGGTVAANYFSGQDIRHGINIVDIGIAIGFGAATCGLSGLWTAGQRAAFIAGNAALGYLSAQLSLTLGQRKDRGQAP